MALEKEPIFSAVDVSVIIHATEDENKVLAGICETLSISANRFRLSESTGHWGNRILLLNVSLEGAEANVLCQTIVSSLEIDERDRLSTFYQSSTDESGNLYLRLDKQRICQHRISLSEKDSIRLRFKAARRFKFGRNSGYLQGGL